MNRRVTLSLRAHGSDDQADEAREELATSARPQACLGPPGTGKTTSLHRCIEATLAKGGAILFTAFTNMFVSRMRERYGTRIAVSTCHAAFNLDNDSQYLPSLDFFHLVIVDEISQLQGHHFQTIYRLWELSGRCFALAICGDKCQMSGPGDTRPWETGQWRSTVFKHSLRIIHRQSADPDFMRLLSELRLSVPCDATMRLLRQRKAWSPPGPPTVDKVLSLFRRTPQTTVAACSRRGAAEINACAIAGLFRNRRPVVVLDADYDSCPTNYINGEQKPVQDLQPTPLPVHVGLRVCFTRTLRRDLDFVNGMGATVLDYNHHTRGLRLRTDTGHVGDLWPWTDPDLGEKTYYPVRAAYATTLLKLAGAELPHITYFCDAADVPGAGYTALSRVRTGRDFLLAGWPQKHHFVPTMSG